MKIAFVCPFKWLGETFCHLMAQPATQKGTQFKPNNEDAFSPDCGLPCPLYWIVWRSSSTNNWLFKHFWPAIFRFPRQRCHCCDCWRLDNTAGGLQITNNRYERSVSSRHAAGDCTICLEYPFINKMSLKDYRTAGKVQASILMIGCVIP